MRLSVSRVAVIFGLIAVLLILATLRNSDLNSTNPRDKSSPESDGNLAKNSRGGLSDGGVITDCITKKVLGRIPFHLDTVSFAGQANGSEETAQERLVSFQKVASKKEWGSETGDPNLLSGPGSTLLYAQEAMAGLHIILSDIKQKYGLSRVRMLDIPCGDMTWMSRFLKTRDDIDYTGYDIVPELIARHRDQFKNRRWEFYQRDIVESPINDTFDLIFSRMMLQHLLTQDALKILQRFSESGSRYLLTTTFPRIARNVELDPVSRGRYRFLNLGIPPVSLAPPECFMRDGEEAPSEGDIHFLALWKLPLNRVRDCSNVAAFKLPGRDFTVYSCIDWTLKN